MVHKYTVDNKGSIRPDFLLSYWIFAWFLLYYFLDTVAIHNENMSYTKWIHDRMNPMIALLFVLSENIFTFVYMIFQKVEFKILLKYLVMMLSIKIIPIYCIRNYPIRLFDNILSFLGILGIYLIYLYTQGEAISSVYNRTFTAIKHVSNQTPFFLFIDSVFNL
jgi:hypothetical protein